MTNTHLPVFQYFSVVKSDENLALCSFHNFIVFTQSINCFGLHKTVRSLLNSICLTFSQGPCNTCKTTNEYNDRTSQVNNVCLRVSEFFSVFHPFLSVSVLLNFALKRCCLGPA